MEAPNSLPRNERLRRRGAIRRLFEQGHSGFIYPFRYLWIEAEEPSSTEGIECKVLFTVPKRFHKRANRRNTLRRRTKEAYRTLRPVLQGLATEPRTVEMAIIYSTKERCSSPQISSAVRKILENVGKNI